MFKQYKTSQPVTFDAAQIQMKDNGTLRRKSGTEWFYGDGDKVITFQAQLSDIPSVGDYIIRQGEFKTLVKKKDFQLLVSAPKASKPSFGKDLKIIAAIIGILFLAFVSGDESGREEMFNEFLDSCVEQGVNEVINGKRLFIECKQVEKELEWVEVGR